VILPDVNLIPFWQELFVLQNSDANLTFTLTQPDGVTPYNLTGYSVNVVVKPSRYLPDNTGVTYSATVATPTSGIATLVIPAANLGTVGAQWYHVDIVGSGSSKVTATIGPFNVQAV
jgi:hypothetical protein